MYSLYIYTGIPSGAGAEFEFMSSVSSMSFIKFSSSFWLLNIKGEY